MVVSKTRSRSPETVSKGSALQVKELKPKLNYQIKSPEVRVFVDDEQLGVMSLSDALKLAGEQGLDLIEIAPGAKPPVCIVESYGKYKYDQNKATKKQPSQETRQIQFGINIEKHDLDVKLAKIREFLLDKDRVQLVMKLRGREMAHPEVGEEKLKEIVKAIEDVGVVQQFGKLDGRQIMVTVVPR